MLQVKFLSQLGLDKRLVALVLQGLDGKLEEFAKQEFYLGFVNPLYLFDVLHGTGIVGPQGE